MTTTHNRVKVYATGVAQDKDFQLGSPVHSFRSFKDGPVRYTVLADSGEWQIAYGIVSGNILSRGTVEDNYLGTTDQITFVGKPVQIAETVSAEDFNSLFTNEHSHTNKALLDLTTAAYTSVEKDKLAVIENEATGDQVASEVPFTSTEDLISTDVQSAISEVQSNLDTLVVPATSVTYDPTNDSISSAIELQTLGESHSAAISNTIPSVSGIISGLTLSQTTSSTFTVATGLGVIINNYTTPGSPTYTPVELETEITTSIQFNALEANITKIYLQSNGAIYQTTNHNEVSATRDSILLGLIATVNGLITEIINASSIVGQASTDLYDTMLSTITREGEKIHDVTNALSIWVSDGTLFYPGINRETDVKDPNKKSINAIGSSTVSAGFSTISITGIVDSATQTVIPKKYNASGTVYTDLTGTEATIHRVYNIGTDPVTRKILLLYGQTVYTDAQDALNKLNQDELESTFPAVTNNLDFLGYVCVSAEATSFASASNAWIISGEQSNITSNGAESGYHDVLLHKDYVDQHPIASIGDTTTDGQLTKQLADRTTWVPIWTTGTCTKNTIARDGGWTMVANKETSDRPAPQLTGTDHYYYSGTLSTISPTASILIYGTRYTWGNIAGFISKIRVSVQPDFNYEIYLVSDPTGTPLFNFIGQITGTSTEWLDVNINPLLVTTGNVFDVIVKQQSNTIVPTTWSANWNYTTPNNPSAPGTGEIIHASNDIYNLHVHKTDNDSTDRSAALEALGIGDHIDTGDYRYFIENITDNSTYMTFQVTPNAQSTTGVTNIIFESIAASVEPYGREIDYYLSDPNATGLFIADGAYSNIAINNNAYGVDIYIEDAVISSDWDLLATTTNTAGSTGSGTAGVNTVNGRAGDVTLTAADVTLENADNTSDLNKPVSTATQTALDLKSDVGHTHNTEYYTKAEIDALLANKSDTTHTHTPSEVGLDQVDNTADADKPISTATQTALDLKADSDKNVRAYFDETTQTKYTTDNDTDPNPNL